MDEVSKAVGGRPWQATFLGVLSIIGAVFAFLVMLFMAFLTFGVGAGVAQIGVPELTGVFNMLSGFVFVGVIIFAGLGVLAIFMARGMFKGQKWAPIVSIVFSVMALVGVLSNFDPVILVIDAFILYLAIMCVKHPFFNR